MRLPDMPSENAPVTVSWGRQVVECLRALRPVKTPTVTPQESPDGTAYHTAPVKPTSAALPACTTLYMVLAVREFDEDGDVVAVGSESYPTLAEGHTLEWVEDWLRLGGT